MGRSWRNRKQHRKLAVCDHCARKTDQRFKRARGVRLSDGRWFCDVTCMRAALSGKPDTSQ